MSYLIYSCHQTKDIVLFMSKNLYIIPQRDGPYDVVQDYLLKKAFDEMGHEEQKYILLNFDLVDTIKHESAYANYVLQRINLYLKYLEKPYKNVSDKKSQNDRTKIQIGHLSEAINKVIAPRISLMKPYILIRCLEET